MINITTLFRNFFDTSKIGDDTLKKFTEDHLERLKDNNPSIPSLTPGSPGLFDEIINQTENAYNYYFNSINKEYSDTSKRKAATFTTDEAFASFLDLISRKEGAIRSEFGAKSAAYIEFFPQGLTEYRTATKTNIEMLMTRFVAACTDHVDVLGADFVAQFQDLLDAYKAARLKQLNQKSKITNDKDVTSNLREALELQLCKNLYFIGYTFTGDTQKCMRFYDQSIIRHHDNSANDGIGRAVGTITGNGMPVVGATIKYVGLNLPVVHSKADGSYKARNVAIGMHQVEVSAAGFQTFTGNVNVVDDGDTELNVTLTALSGT